MSRKLLAGTVLLGAAILVVVFNFTPSAVYSRSVSDFLARPIREQRVRIQGTLVPGSICRRDDPCEWRFSLADRWLPPPDAGPATPKAQLFVRYAQCLTPDTFRDGENVTLTVEGELCASCHRFEASQIFAKMTGKYEMKPSGQATPAPTWKPMPLCTGS